MEKWWHDAVVYQIYPRSFADSNGDGIGDIPGIIARLDYLKNLGINLIWLSPVYRSPDADNGYDISDYRDIDPRYGTMADMDALIAEAKKRDIRIVMDLVINHTSDEHEWFRQSRDPKSPYRDYYIWRPEKNGGPPNNWTSFFGGDCWKKDERSGEYYLHLFAEKQPDLNYDNPRVLEEIKDIMRFWLDKGIGGFRCDVINLIHKTSLVDGKKRLVLTGSEHYISQEGTHEILRTLRKDVLSHYDCFTVGETVFVTPQMGRDLTDEKRGELDMIFSFEHMETDQFFVKWFRRKFSPARFARSIATWQNALEWNALYLENHDQPRSVSRFGNDGMWWSQSAKLLCTLLLTLRGTPFIYQGEEIGMTNFDFTSMEQLQDVESHNIYRMAKKLCIPASYRWKMMQRTSRDNARTPMQWTAKAHAGFTTGTPWLGVNANHQRINVDSQKDDSQSILSYYRTMIALRASLPVLRTGSFHAVKMTKSLFIYERQLSGQPSEQSSDEKIRVLLNFSPRNAKAEGNGDVLLSSYGNQRTTYDGILRPWEALLLRSSETEPEKKR
ncbi:alpha-glucosidase [Parasphaerochaeta coccoides]|uniref:Oligo-1,6-glucosidase n=1 Tax=Parasphaerochaeta coccoides (strain ATCC BAA-1237 / DSM 17374 / SPN1) TaxID=760011 RepID=F4GH94_PARC1|nr:alpha-glucosidase [Parasphaerochaeta coccoides]AEC01993.1 Oligo-1,6-glucosidase [Parasphaerochaeta coccoides DSM 17374]